MDSENEFMDPGLENELLPYPIPENLSPTLTPVPTLTAAVKRPSPQKILKKNSSQGLSSSIHASTKDIANEQELCPSLPRSGPRTTSRIIEHPSASMKNGIAASLLAWQNARAQHLRALPPTIIADLKIIVTRSATRVIAGLPIIEPPQTAHNLKVSAQPYPKIEPPKVSLYADAAKKNLALQIQPP